MTRHRLAAEWRTTFLQSFWFANSINSIKNNLCNVAKKHVHQALNNKSKIVYNNFGIISSSPFRVILLSKYFGRIPPKPLYQIILKFLYIICTSFRRAWRSSFFKEACFHLTLPYKNIHSKFQSNPCNLHWVIARQKIDNIHTNNSGDSDVLYMPKIVVRL